MSQILYDSTNVNNLMQEIKNHWENDFGEPCPGDEAAWQMAWDIMDMDHEEVVFKVKECPNQVIMFGNIGRWNGSPFAYKVCDADVAFSPGKDTEDLVIASEDNDIVVTQIHHDGRNVLTVRGLKDIWDIESDDDINFLEDLVRGEVYITPEDIPRVRKVTTSLVPYFNHCLKEEKDGENDSQRTA